MDNEGRDRGGGGGGEAARDYADLSDEDRYVVIRSRIIDAEISDSAVLPDSIRPNGVAEDSKSGAGLEEGEEDDGKGEGSDDEDDGAEEAWSTSQFRALRWIASKDPRRLDPDDPELMERYALTSFYFSAGGADSVRLVDEDGNLDVQRQWTKYYGWLSSMPACAWAGVDCHIHTSEQHFAEETGLTMRQEEEAGEHHDNAFEVSEYVQELRLPSNGLKGTIPPEVVHALGQLKYLDLSGNELEGSVPKGIWKLRDLVSINLSHNRLGGHVLSALSALPQIRSIDLSSNVPGLSGTIPPSIGQATSLRVLRLSDNSFDGTVPSELGHLWRLASIDLDSNRLEGSLPDDSLAKGLKNLVRVSIRSNQLTGSLPRGILSLPYLEVFRAGDNTFGGTIPGGDIFHGSSDLRSFEVGDNDLTGTIPEEVGTVRGLKTLRLSNNGLTGLIPESLGELERLEVADFHGNELTGIVPEGMCVRRREAQDGEGGHEGEDGTHVVLGVLSADCGKSDRIECGCCRGDECH
uniref:Leucine-rich repeat-containing N-terminal plant-type domain-containing protein n=1 Tax=Odontella aurita TaxID=265563 RepID=A0A7S4I8Y2_9STRA|mmetsp:Transcript_21570/g.63243  ORF Transcript_21570/g.63243 Transcript_21570/m.63243 type:complete len:521 (+) Transcript_21570:713-2275(+)